jgi:predicted acyl esterase
MSVILIEQNVRLEVSSSNFLRFSRNSNTGGEIASVAANQYVSVINRVFRDAHIPTFRNLCT